MNDDLMFGYNDYKETLIGNNRHADTKYIGGIFKLKKGDAIYIAVKASQYLLSPKSSFFGLYLLHASP